MECPNQKVCVCKVVAGQVWGGGKVCVQGEGGGGGGRHVPSKGKGKGKGRGRGRGTNLGREERRSKGKVSEKSLDLINTGVHVCKTKIEKGERKMNVTKATKHSFSSQKCQKYLGDLDSSTHPVLALPSPCIIIIWERWAAGRDSLL